MHVEHTQGFKQAMQAYNHPDFYNYYLPAI